MAAYKTLRRFCARSYNQLPCTLILILSKTRLIFKKIDKFINLLDFITWRHGELCFGIYGSAGRKKARWHKFIKPFSCEDA